MKKDKNMQTKNKAKAKSNNKVTEANANNNKITDENIGFENNTKDCK